MTVSAIITPESVTNPNPIHINLTLYKQLWALLGWDETLAYVHLTASKL